MTARDTDDTETERGLGTAKSSDSGAETPDDAVSLGTTPEDVRRDVAEETRRADLLEEERDRRRQRGDALPPIRGRPKEEQPRDHPHHMHSADNGGHWWTLHEAYEAPEWYLTKYETEWRAPPPEDAPEVPDDLAWDEYVAYHCKVCGEECINRRDSDAAQHSECWSCNELPELR